MNNEVMCSAALAPKFAFLSEVSTWGIEFA